MVLKWDLFLIPVNLILKPINIVIMTVSMMKKRFGKLTIMDMLEVTTEVLMKKK